MRPWESLRSNDGRCTTLRPGEDGCRRPSIATSVRICNQGDKPPSEAERSQRMGSVFDHHDCARLYLRAARPTRRERSAGAGNFHGFREFVIEPSAVRILPYLNISFAGIFAFFKSVMVGECSDVRLLYARACLEVAE